MKHLDLLSAELKRRGMTKRHLSREMGWHEDTIARWGEHGPGKTSKPWIDDLDRCWNYLGMQLVPVRTADLKSWRLDEPLQPRVNKPSRNCHRIIDALFEEMEARNFPRRVIADKAGVGVNTLGRMATGKSRGKPEILEACFNVMGLSLVPVHMATLAALKAAA
jgi:hypothetical protein